MQPSSLGERESPGLVTHLTKLSAAEQVSLRAQRRFSAKAKRAHHLSPIFCRRRNARDDVSWPCSYQDTADPAALGAVQERRKLERAATVPYRAVRSTHVDELLSVRYSELTPDLVHDLLLLLLSLSGREGASAGAASKE